MTLIARLRNRIREANVWISSAAIQFQDTQKIAHDASLGMQIMTRMQAPFSAIYLGFNVIAAALYAVGGSIATVVHHAGASMLQGIRSIGESFLSLFKREPLEIVVKIMRKNNTVTPVSSKEATDENPEIAAKVEIQNSVTPEVAAEIEIQNSVTPVSSNPAAAEKLAVAAKEFEPTVPTLTATIIKDKKAALDAAVRKGNLRQLELSQNEYKQGQIKVIPATPGIFGWLFNSIKTAITPAAATKPKQDISFDTPDYVKKQYQLG